ncbi:DUF6302 family protein [Streptomyces sp. MZ04]|uniref:DUF6302 family protein n=1 Tax=Streptomyces sp. MZ04 TaxID=2559236 RepID=UPI00107EAFE4|nr:DUF6302 family protein [Streptomyces sp. MZ04]TGB08720.1 hypothetical protein E2651_18225 [Streptomyces sp. MZ04]
MTLVFEVLVSRPEEPLPVTAIVEGAVPCRGTHRGAGCRMAVFRTTADEVDRHRVVDVEAAQPDGGLPVFSHVPLIDTSIALVCPAAAASPRADGARAEPRWEEPVTVHRDLSLRILVAVAELLRAVRDPLPGFTAAGPYALFHDGRVRSRLVGRWGRLASGSCAPARGKRRFLLARIAAPLVCPTVQECAEEIEWLGQRLADPGLLDRALGVQVDGAVLLAVPTGSTRSGGYLSVSSVASAVRAWAALRGKPGYPRARLILSRYRDTCHNVAWGPRQPHDDVERGRYFGYSPLAIATFLNRDRAPLCSPPPRPAEWDGSSPSLADGELPP